MSSSYWPVHAHSAFSVMDGMNPVKAMVSRVAELGQVAMALTDHGSMAGTVQGYQACRKAGLAFFPGAEWYLVKDVTDEATRGDRYHLGMVALDLTGLQALNRLMTLSFRKERFYRKPIIDLADLATLSVEGYADHIAVTTGCYSGIVIDQWQTAGRDPVAHAERMIQMLSRWFPHLYVEIQDHGITWPCGTRDNQIGMHLYGIAQRMGLPVVIGGDSHYVHASEQAAHDLMKDICYFGDGEDNHFSGGPYHLASEQEALRPWPKLVREAAQAGHEDLLDKHALTIPALDKYKFHVPQMVRKDPGGALRDMAEGFLDTWLAARPKVAAAPYWDRLDLELSVIDTMKMSNYFMLVREHVTEWCRQAGITVNTRGSANGSLLCFVMGITNVDPIQWSTSFDRFLSLDRKKPPDIDIDVDYRGRRALINHLGAVFPTMVQVGTYSKIGFGAPDEFGEETGSVIVQYMAAMARKGPGFAGKVLPEHRGPLDALAATEVYKSMGTNAAGFILPGDDLPIDEYLPLARVISSDTTLTQFTKDDVEALGYMKLDVLGLRALETLNGTLRRIGKQPNEWDWIPLDDKKACALLRSGHGIGLFQYEGFSSERGGREMGIKSTLDTILGLALYRPALMNGGQKDLFLHNRVKPYAQQDRLPPLFDHVVKDTSGVPLFQEQILEMLKALGMVFADYNDLMTAIKASNGFIQGAADTFARLLPVFYDLCEDKGLSDDEADKTWGAVIGFTEYGFNRAHATSYGLMAYWSAYLKAHHPFEFMASVLNVWVGEQKEVLLVREAKRLGYTIVRADVNASGSSWEIDKDRPNALRKGLVSLKGIGWNVADCLVENRPPEGYTSIQDVIDRNPARPVTGGKTWKTKGELVGVMHNLREIGALRSVDADAG